MDLPFRFPDPLEDATKRAEQFQRLPQDERVRQLMDVIQTGMILVRESPNREAMERVFQQREAEWQRIQRECFARHGE